jgi:hypothetical protein
MRQWEPKSDFRRDDAESTCAIGTPETSLNTASYAEATGTEVAAGSRMRCGTFTSAIRRLTCLGPVMIAASLVVPEQGGWRLGVADALGCTGGGPGTGGAVAPPEPMWQRLAPAGEPGAVAPLATDGFLPLHGVYSGLSVEEALASINLVVTDETGKAIPGRIEAFGAPERQVFGWTATASLAIGQHLTASISVPAALDPFLYLTTTYALEVVGPPEALPEPSARFHGWSDTYKGVGPLVSCKTPANSCTGSSSAQVASAYEATGHVVELGSHVAPKSGVAWEITTAQSSRAPESTLSSYTALVTSSYSGGEVGYVRFGLTADQVCAIVIVKDLRTGAEVRGEVCRAPEPATSIATDGLPLSNCDEPPSAAARDLWCEARKKDSRPCEPTAANPSEPTVPGPVASDPMNADAAASDRAAGTSKGCQLGGPGSTASWGAWALFLAALSGGVARRRRYWA